MQPENDWIDFKQAISFEMVLEHYNLLNGLRKDKDELRGRCPIHKGEGEQSFHVNLLKNLFFCFSCKAQGNMVDFVAVLEQCSVKQAALKIEEFFILLQSEVVMQATSTSLINTPLKFQLSVDHSHEYGLRRGLSIETLENFGAGYCRSEGIYAGRYVIPLHNEQGELVGYAGRSLDDAQPKYIFPPADGGFRKSHLLFNLHRVVNEKSHRRDEVRGRITTPLILVEGFFSAMKLHRLNYSCVALLGSSLSEEQEKTLSSYFNHTVLLFDGDDAGKALTNDCLLRLGRQMWVTAVDIGLGRQPDQLTDQELRSLLYS